MWGNASATGGSAKCEEVSITVWIVSWNVVMSELSCVNEQALKPLSELKRGNEWGNELIEQVNSEWNMGMYM